MVTTTMRSATCVMGTPDDPCGVKGILTDEAVPEPIGESKDGRRAIRRGDRRVVFAGVSVRAVRRWGSQN